MNSTFSFTLFTAILSSLSLGANAADSNETAFEVTPTAQLQVWSTIWDQDEDPTADPAAYGDPEHDPGFSIRRGRIGMTARYGNIEGLFQMGVGAPYDALTLPDQDVRIANAFVRGSMEMGPGTGRLAAGFVKVPFSREGLMSSADLTFQERSVHAAWLAPIQDLGVLADWYADFGLQVSAGVFNGGGSMFGDNNGGLLYGGRIAFEKGNTLVSYSREDQPAFGFAVSAFYNDDVATQTLSYEADFIVKVAGFHVMGEFAQSNIKPGNTTIDNPDVLASTTRRGISSQLGYTIPVAQGELEIASRIAFFDDAIALKDNGDVLVIHGGATIHNVVPTLDVGLGYIHREELQGRGIANDTIRLWTQFQWPAVRRDGK